MNIQECEASRKLDKQIALKVMGWMERPNGSIWDPKNRQDAPVYNVPHYSTEVGDAWKVVQALRKEGFDFDSFSSATRTSSGWTDVNFISQVEEFAARAETFPHAVCLAALMAVEK